ncbi:MAG: ComEC/Rec2 family competence protein [Parcubacteria group bacterium]|nr:ComEC/Rec2 family competence protein [Parcubacteria group bacterium]
MSKSRIFLIWLLCFIAGIFFASYISWPKLFLIFLSIVSSAVILVFRKEKIIFIFAGGILIFSLGFLRIAGIAEKKSTLDQYLDKKIISRGIVMAEPKTKGESTSFLLEIRGEKIQIRTRNYPIINYGDELEVQGQLKSVQNSAIRYALNWPKIEIQKKDQGNFFKSSLFKLKEKFSQNISQNMPEPEASLLAGYIFGSRNLPSDVEQNFKTLGLSHIVAVSGFNLSVIALFISQIFTYFNWPRFLKFWSAVSIIFLFVLMIGFPSSAMRAAIMAILVLVAEKEGRLYESAHAIIFAGALMLLLDPLILRFDLGFSLSFLATLGLIFLSPILPKYLPQLVSQTLAAQIFVLPVLLLNFGVVSPYSLLVNFLILPLVPLAMLLGFLAGLTGFIFQILAEIISWLAWPILFYQIKIAQFFSFFPYAKINFGKISLIFAFIYYAAIGFIIFKNRNKVPTSTCGADVLLGHNKQVS